LSPPRGGWVMNLERHHLIDQILSKLGGNEGWGYRKVSSRKKQGRSITGPECLHWGGRGTAMEKKKKVVKSGCADHNR